MKKFVVKRVLLSIVILFFVSMIIYAIMRCMPSSFVEQQALTLSQRPGAKSYDEWVAQLNASYGLDTGVIQGYFRWAAKAIRGQFGDSWYFNQPVLTKFASVIWYSFALSLASFVLEIIIAIPAGIAAARKQYSATDYTITVIALVGISLPSFFVATLLKWVFSVKLGWFDLYGIVGRNFQSLSSGRQTSGNHTDDREHRFPDALHQNQHARGAECGLYPYSACEGTAGEARHSLPRIPQYLNPDHHTARRYIAGTLQWSHGNRDSVPDPGYRIYLLPGGITG